MRQEYETQLHMDSEKQNSVFCGNKLAWGE